MLKLVIDSIKYYYPESNQEAVICRINSTLIESKTNAVISKFNRSTRIVKSDEDESDIDFAKNLAFSWSKIKSYRAAYNYIKNKMNPMDLNTIIGKVYMKRFENNELNHINYLYNDYEPLEWNEYHVGDLYIDVLREVLNVIPILRNKDEGIIAEIQNQLDDIEDSYCN